MAVRPVFMAVNESPFSRTVNVDFVWNSGFAASQKQKNIKAMHEAFGKLMPDKKVFEVSSKSLQEGGESLSAFNLKKYVPSLNKSVPVECVFQAGKIFQRGGNYQDLLNVNPKEAKTDERLRNSGEIVGFTFEDKKYPTEPKTAFYDFIYINALLENPELSKILLQYDAFTDIEFNPYKSLNCQARTAAVFVGLSRAGQTDVITDFDKFLNTVYFS